MYNKYVNTKYKNDQFSLHIHQKNNFPILPQCSFKKGSGVVKDNPNIPEERASDF